MRVFQRFARDFDVVRLDENGDAIVLDRRRATRFDFRARELRREEGEFESADEGDGS
jgi:hypothetical protein